jgi:ribonuclease R
LARGRTPSDRNSRSRLPSFPALVEFLRSRPESASARETARAFGLSPGDIAGLRGMLRAIERSGEVARAGDRKFIAGEALSDILPIERFANDTDGTPLVRPVGDKRTDAPSFRLIGAAGDELVVGDKALARLIRRDTGEVEAEIIRRLDPSGARVVGVFRRSRDGGVIVAADRRNRSEYHVLAHDAAGLADDELVIAEELPSRQFGKRARIIERLGPANAPGAISRMMIAEFEIPAEFPEEVIAAAAAAPRFSMAGRADLRHLALVTIDGSDARDFDDAVWAEPDSDAANPGGWHLIVAIADIAAYVLSGSPLDREAAKRGNSVYFPDRVVPMLPEALSNDLCSLKPGEDRPCMAAELWIDTEGRKRRHHFTRAVMRSAARLTYDEMQAGHDAVDRASFPLAA